MSRTAIAFVAPVPHGQSNTHLAIIRRLLSLDSPGSPSLDIHLLSDEPLRKRTLDLPLGPRHTFMFHAVGEEDLFAGQVATLGAERTPPASLFTRGGRKAYDGISAYLYPPPDRYLERYRRIVEVFEKIRPAFAVVDVIMRAGVDACHTVGIRHGRLAPNPSLDICVWQQPLGRAFWKYPAPFSTIPYPVPLIQIPHNILLGIYLIFSIVLSSRALNIARKALGLPGSTPMLPGIGKRSEFMLFASIPELEYPHIPYPNAVLAGPILTPEPPLSEDTDAELTRFLGRQHTVLINLGSIFQYAGSEVVAVARAIVEARERLDGRDGGFQVLWKLPRKSEFSVSFRAVLGDEMDEWVRIEEWIRPPSLAVLQHPNLVAFVHHGGANSVHEAAYAGVPQIILPQWYDLYSLAQRVETIGHGIFANRGFEGTIDAAQLADALVRVCSDQVGEPGHALRMKAQELARACKAAQGVEKAAETVLRAALGPQFVI